MINSRKISLLQRVSQVRIHFRFSNSIEIQEEHKGVTESIILDGQEMSKYINDTESETEHASNEHSLNMYRTAPYETTIASEIPKIIDEVNVVIAPEQEKISVFI